MGLYIELLIDVDTGGEPYECKVWDGNITHNLTGMAHEVGIYKPLWRPNEFFNKINIYAGDLVEPLSSGLKNIIDSKERLMTMEPRNGYGSYDWLREFVTQYRDACKKYPKAKVYAER